LSLRLPSCRRTAWSGPPPDMWTGGHRHGRRPLRRAAAVGLAASIAAAACTSSAPQSGTSLVRGYGTILGLAPLKPGAELGLLLLAPENRSRSPLTISSVTLVGRGVGTIITVVHVKIAPDEKGNNSAPGGGYGVSAPEAWWPPAASCAAALGPATRIPASTQSAGPSLGRHPGGRARQVPRRGPSRALPAGWHQLSAAHPGWLRRLC
jgi:hypothetical protein